MTGWPSMRKIASPVFKPALAAPESGDTDWTTAASSKATPNTARLFSVGWAGGAACLPVNAAAPAGGVGSGSAAGSETGGRLFWGGGNIFQGHRHSLILAVTAEFHLNRCADRQPGDILRQAVS